MPLKIAIIVPPLRGNTSFYPPFGALSVMAAAQEDGHDSYLLDFDARRCSYSEMIKQIRDLSPDVIGISAVVSTAYRYAKELSLLIKQKMPDTVVVVGGGLSAAADVVLSNCTVDIVVHGEGEITFKELLKNIENERSLEGVKGISFKNNGKIITNPPRELIKDLDILPFPDYDLLNLDKYILDMRKFVKERDYGISEKIDQRVFDIKRSPKFIRINISRGCVNRCTFCYRNMPGIRIHSFEYIGDLIEHFKKKYDIGHISFGDECFGPDKKWLWDFIKMIKERKFDLTYHITGMRVHAIDEGIMAALKEIGVWHIQFGFESGSQKILNIMEKNTTVEQNVNAALLAKKNGINTIPFIIIGYPGETVETLYQTIKFLQMADLISQTFRPTFPMAMPGTPLYEYARLMGYISEENKYLEAISDLDTTILSDDNYFINYTDEPDSVVLSWLALIKDEVNKYYDKGLNKPNKAYLLELFQRFTSRVKTIGLRKSLFLVFNKINKIIKKSLKKCFHKNTNNNKCKIQFEPEGESLRKINERLRARILYATKVA